MLLIAMIPVRNIASLLGGCLLMIACAGSPYVVDRNPQKHNPVDEIAWLRKQKKELENMPCRIALFEKEGKAYYSIYMPVPGAFDKSTTVVYDEEGNLCLKYGGLMPPARRVAVEQFFKDAVEKGVIWECRLREPPQESHDK